MKKIILIILIFEFLGFRLIAEPIDIFDLNPIEDSSILRKLSMEDQYNSLMLSFKTKTRGIPVPYESKWAKIITEKWGRELLPLINKTLQTCELDNQYREPISHELGNLGYFFEAFVENEMFTELEISLYTIVLNEKIDKYICKYRVIDRAVYIGFFLLGTLKQETIPWGNIDFAKEYYEKKLGITGIAIGSEIFEKIVPSPLAEYITD